MKITHVRPLRGFRLELAFSEGSSGVVDLSDYAGRGVFETWLTPGAFEQVAITDQGALAWPGELYLCPDALYFRLTGKTAAEVFHSLRQGQPAYA